MTFVIQWEILADHLPKKLPTGLIVLYCKELSHYMNDHHQCHDIVIVDQSTENIIIYVMTLSLLKSLLKAFTAALLTFSFNSHLWGSVGIWTPRKIVSIQELSIEINYSTTIIPPGTYIQCCTVSRIIIVVFVVCREHHNIVII